MNVSIFTDGACRGNPNGNGGYGVVLKTMTSKGEVTKELSAGYKSTTNNRMELMGVLRGLESLNKPCIVNIFSDSQYVVKAFNDGWIDNWIKKGWKTSTGKAVKNPDLWKKILKAKEPHNVTFHWVKGHDGHPENERCDQLATLAADNNAVLDDTILI